MRIVVLLAALLFAPTAFAQAHELSWLTGCWRTEASSGPVVTEVWTAPPGHVLFGYAYTEGATPSWEQMRVELSQEPPVLVAMPNGGAPVRFALDETIVHVGPTPAGGATFKNPDHDDPQTVQYRRDRNTLTAIVSGANGANAVTFTFHRIRCPTNLRP